MNINILNTINNPKNNTVCIKYKHSSINKSNIVKIKLILFLLLNVSVIIGQEYIAGYEIAKEEVLRKIPQEYIYKARNQFKVAYQHTSHGTHVSFGTYGLQDFKAGDDTLFAVSNNNETNKLYLNDNNIQDYATGARDLSTVETGFITATRRFLDDTDNHDINVVMYAWCNIAGHDINTNYIPGMDSLISEYGVGGTKIGTGTGQRAIPVTFIFMTGHGNASNNIGDGKPKNQADIINDYCSLNHYFCLDYFSIDAHDMDDNYWSDAGDNGNSVMYGGNFYENYQASHTLGSEYYENKNAPGGSIVYGEHNTQHITANRKAYAFWWILARMAGWDGDTTSVSSHIPTDSVSFIIYPVHDTIDTDDGSIQISSSIYPLNATKNIYWLVEDENIASVTGQGIVVAKRNGTAKVIAFPEEYPEKSDTAFIFITNQVIQVESIEVYGTGNATTISTFGGTLQMDVNILPVDAENQNVEWSVSNDKIVTIDESGLLAALSNGEVTVTATALDGSGVTGDINITVTNQEILITDIIVSGENSKSIIDIDKGTLQISTEILPVNATNQSIEWSVSNDKIATIDESGLLAALSNGEVTVTASALDGSGVTGDINITVTNQEILITDIIVSGENSKSIIDIDKGTLQMSTEILPVNATNQSIEWSVSNDKIATIDESGLLAALSNGEVTVIAEALDGSGIKDSFKVAVSNQFISVENIEITIGNTTVSVDDESFQISASITPSDASNKNIIWKINDPSIGSINANGIFSAKRNGVAIVTCQAVENNTVYDSIVITISGQVVQTDSIHIYGYNNSADITTLNGTLQILTDYFPSDAEQQNIAWKVINKSGSAEINETGLISAFSDGKVLIKAILTDNPEISDSIMIDISNQTTLVNKSEFSKIKIYPNPLKDYLNIEFNSENRGTYKITLFTPGGIIAYSKKFTGNSGIIDLTKVEAGNYIMQIYNDNEISYFMISKY